MSTPIAEAVVAIRPDVDVAAFKRQVNEQVRAAFAGTRATVPVTLDDSDVQRGKKRVKADVDELGKAKATPKVTLDDQATRKLDDIRVRLADVGSGVAAAKVRLDGDTTAQRQLLSMQDQLLRLGARTASPRLNVTGVDSAELQLEALSLKLDEIGRKDEHAKVKVDGVGDALAGIGAVQAALLALAPAGVAGVAGLAGLAGGVAPLALAGIGGAGAVGVLGLSGVGSAYSALRARDTAAHVAAARAAGGDTAQQRADRQHTAAEAVAAARQNVANTQYQNARDRVDAARRVTDAEYALGEADTRVTDAQQALNQARADAVRRLQDLKNAEVDTANSVKDAEFAVTDAKRAQYLVDHNAHATAEDRAKAAQAVAEAEQNLTEQQQASKRATQDYQQAQKDGVAHAPAVVAAEEQLKAAQHDRTLATRELSDATEAQRRLQVTAAQQTAAAQQQLTDALHAQAEAQQKAATGAAATNTQLVKANQTLAKLDPATVAFAKDLIALHDGPLAKLRADAAGAFLPGLDTALQDFTKEYFPLFDTGVKTVGHTLADLAVEGARTLGDPFWMGFAHYMSDIAPNAISTGVHALGDIAAGFAGIMEAFRPLIGPLEQGVLRLTGDFANWGEQLGSSSGFHQFIAYVRQEGPELLHVLGDLGSLLVTVLRDAAPLGPVVLDVLDKLATTVDDLLTAHPLIGTVLVGTLTTGLGLASLLSRLAKVLDRFGVLDTVLGKVPGRMRGIGTAATAATAEVEGLATAESEVAAAGGAGVTSGGRAAGVAGAASRAGGLLAAVGTVAAMSPAGQEIFESLLGSSAPSPGKQSDQQKQLQSDIDAILGNYSRQHEKGGPGSGLTDGTPNPINDPLYSASFGQNDSINIAAATKFVEKYGTAAQKAAIAAAGGANANAMYGGSLTQVRTYADSAVDGLQALGDALNGAGKQGIDATTATIDYKQAVDDARTAAEQNGRTLDLNTEAGRANSQQLIDLAQHSTDYVTTLAAQGRSLQSLNPQIQQNYENFVSTAEAMGATKQQADDLARKYGLIPKDVRTKIETTGLDPLNKGLDHLLDTIVKVNGHSIRVHYDAATGDVTFRDSAGHAVHANAAGGPILGPGTGTSDSIRALGPDPRAEYRLSNDEHVWTAAEVADVGGHSAVYRLRALARAGLLRGFSTGGPVISVADDATATEQLLAAAKVLNQGSAAPAVAVGAIPASRAALVALGQRMAASWGWTGPEWTAMRDQIDYESGWNNLAQNPTSTAFGLAQFLDSTWATVGLKKTSDPPTQLTGYHRYVKGRYGDPLASWDFERAHRYYAGGGPVGKAERALARYGAHAAGEQLTAGIDFDRLTAAIVAGVNAASRSINVHGSSDPHATAAEVRRLLDFHLGS